MRQYQEAQLSDLSGGLTDNYKEQGLMFNRYLNFIPTPHRTARLRRGYVPYAKADNLTTINNVNGIISLKTLEDYFSIASVGKKIMSKSVGAYEVTPFGTGVDDVCFPNLSNTLGEESIVSIDSWRDSVIINPDSEDKPVLVTVETGTPSVVKAFKASLPAVIDVATVTAGDRLYAVCIVRTYTSANGYTYKDYSPEYLGTTNDTISISSVTPAVGTLGVEYGDDIKYALFVTKPNGTVLYAADETEDPTVTPLIYTGSESADRELEKGEKGFFLSEEPKIEIPTNKYMFSVGDTYYYANVTTDAGDNKGNRLFQAVQGMPTSVLASGYTDMDNEILGGGEANGVPIVLTETSVYRLDGVLGVDGTGSVRKQIIAGANGGISHLSIVNTETYTYYAGTDGFYRTDGYKAANITESRLYKSYSSLIKNRKDWKYIQGTFDRDNNLIYWKMSDSEVWVYNISTGTFGELNYPSSIDAGIRYLFSTADENKQHLSVVDTEISRDVGEKTVTVDVDSARAYTIDSAVAVVDSVGDIHYGSVSKIDSNTAPTTTLVTISFTDDVSLYPSLDSSNIYLNGDETVNRLYVCMGDGLVKYSDNDVRFDSIDDSGNGDTATKYGRHSIGFDMLTSGISYGAKAAKKWVKSLTANIQADTAIAIAPYVIVDDNGDKAYMANIDNKDQFNAFDENDINGRTSMSWFPDTMIRNTRHMPRNYQLCWYNQVGLSPADISLLDSKEYQTAKIISFDDSGSFPIAVVRLDTKDGFTLRFPRDITNNTISVKGGGNENFSTHVKILSLNSIRTDIEIVANSYVSSLSVGDTIDWIIYGKPVSQSFEVTSLAIDYSIVSKYGAGVNASDSSESKYD